jgi:hypothetical protein
MCNCSNRPGNHQIAFVSTTYPEPYALKVFLENWRNSHLSDYMWNRYNLLKEESFERAGTFPLILLFHKSNASKL